MTDTTDLIQRLRGASQGHDEWRAQNPEDACYCISFSRIDSLDPEREARSWLADHNKSFPQGPFLGYEVKCVRVLTDADRLRLEAADALEQQAYAAKVASDMAEIRERVIAHQKNIIREQAAQIAMLEQRATCGCGDQFTAHDPGTCGNCCAAADRSNEIEALRADAERWRHVQHGFAAQSVAIDGMHSWTWRGYHKIGKGANIDEAVDAALRQEQPT